MAVRMDASSFPTHGRADGCLARSGLGSLLSQVGRSRPGAPMAVRMDASSFPTLTAKDAVRMGRQLLCSLTPCKKRFGFVAFPGLRIQTWGTHGRADGRILKKQILRFAYPIAHKPRAGAPGALRSG